METGREQLKRYTELTGWIRELSSPQLMTEDDAEQYRLTLIRNFTRIGELARLNRDILDEYYYPLLQSEDPLSSESITAMREFADALLDAYSMENLDLPIMYLQSNRLLRDAEEKEDLPMLLRALDDVVISAFTMMHMTYRLTPCYNVCYEYRDIGLKAGERILAYLEPSRFQTLPDEECKEIVLINARYISTLFERGDAFGDAEINAHDIAVLQKALDVAQDPFYQAQVPHYDWTYHNFRTLQYISSLIYSGNVRRFNKEQLDFIYDCTMRMEALWKREELYLSAHSTQSIIDLSVARSSYYAGKTDVAQYKNALLTISKKRDAGNFSFHSNMLNLLVPLEYILVLDKNHLTKGEEQLLNSFYRRLISYLHRMPKQGSLTFVITFLADILKNFIEVPGGASFESICLELMAALHPQTYVHTLNVADLTGALTKHLIRQNPKLFYDFAGCTSDGEVLEKEEEIREFAFRAALLHDVGKIFIIENILTYGRDLFSEEFDLIRAHPSIGAYMLEQFPKTAGYANIARGHHRYYDNSDGYPEEFNSTTCRERTIIAIVTCADCLDAATDTVGRSYKTGKTFQAVLEELREGCGKRYAPWVKELFADREVLQDIEEILNNGREKNYRNTYHVLETL